MNDKAVRNLIERAEISDVVIRFTSALDAQDWQLFRSCLSDEIEIDFYDSTGQSASTQKAEDFAAFGQTSLEGLKTQHLNLNHEITISEDRATCISKIFAMHHRPNSYGLDFFNMHGYYVMDLVRSLEGWKIEKVKQSLTWCEGNPTLLPVNLSYS
jgi:hypothetical protein